ncbi:AraC-like DNA-binding protein [Pullulanibacillus pueri]|uniref:HTH araC/xylS-type domain-containing protein n=1 Tax=Pullulanibacillus pueri TaxID=1437324 RepID=A0A8J2ZZ53_9BACL|nr:AraC family transcriptional regulator [Pullulanibacillus pueri]MBM7683922.1 AraC-like DNA-binding protein [Pullulanibacillus pueri]GGH87932.1 hypothetical protein GCM10007096_39090 [Pullulanibacillus pueri]
MDEDLIINYPRYVEGKRLQLSHGQTYNEEIKRNEHVTGLVLITEGRGHFIVEEETHTAVSGMLLVCQQGVSYQVISDGKQAFKALYIGLSSLHLKGLPKNHLIEQERAPILPLGKVETGDYRQIMESMILESQNGLPESGVIVNGWLSVLIGRLVQRWHHRKWTTPKHHSSSTEAILAVKRLIEERYQEEWTLEKLANEVHLSSYHLCRQFKRKIGMPPGQYIIHCRIEAAKQYLTFTNETMEHIADKIGYRSETHFHQVFKKNTGITPGHYRVIKRENDKSNHSLRID